MAEAEQPAAGGPSSKIDVKLQGKSVVRIYMLDNSTKTLLVDGSTTAGELCKTMAEKIGLRDPANTAAYFAIYEAKNGATVDRPLADNEEVLSVTTSWEEGANSLLVFQVKLFMESAINSTDPKMVHLLHAQAVHHVITGIYPVEDQMALKLAALQVQARFGDHDPATHKIGFLTQRLREFIPAPLFRMSSKSAEAWETLLWEEHAKLTGTEDPKRAYLDILRNLDFYGCAFFVAKQKDFNKLPKQILLAVSSKGIQIMKVGRKSPYLQFKLSEIYRWGFKPDTNFYFEVKKVGGSGPVYEFDTPEGNRISDLLTDYAMALLKELGINTNDDSGESGGGMNDEQAAVAIQASFRGYRLRRDLEREYAAIRVQAVWRGHAERVKFDKMIEKMEAELEDGAPPPPEN